MLQKLTYKQKNQLLIVASILLLLLVYVFAIKKTILVYKDYQSNTSQLELANNAPFTVARLEKELSKINAQIATQDTSKQNNSEKLIEYITHYCQLNKTILREFPKLEVAEQGDLLVETNRFTVCGSFTPILNLVYTIEQKNKLGKIASVNYKTQKDFKTKEIILTATIYLQNIKKK
jgi:hypothetical protein